MILDLTPGFVANILTGLALAGFGAFVLTIRPRGRANIALAVGLIGTGIGAATNNVAWAPGLQIEGNPWPSTLEVITGLTHAIAAVAFAWLGLVFPKTVRPHQRRQLALPGAILMVLVLLTLYVLIWQTASVLFHTASGAGFLISYLGRGLHRAVLIAGAALFAVRFHATARNEHRERGLYALLAAAFVIHPAMRWVGMELMVPSNERLGLELVVITSALLLVTLLWIWATFRSTGSATARNVALLIPAAALVAAIAYLVGWTGASAIARIAGMVLLSYAILQHQLLGIDVKVRWTISRTTLAGIFVAVFFIFSEAAQEFFGATLGSTYFGILAAGVLVFAIAPLSRFADRVAARAVPIAEPGNDRAERSYRRMLERFLADGSLSRDDERALAELAGDLGIDAGRAFALREEVELSAHSQEGT